MRVGFYIRPLLIGLIPREIFFYNAFGFFGLNKKTQFCLDSRENYQNVLHISFYATPSFHRVMHSLIKMLLLQSSEPIMPDMVANQRMGKKMEDFIINKGNALTQYSVFPLVFTENGF